MSKSGNTSKFHFTDRFAFLLDTSPMVRLLRTTCVLFAAAVISAATITMVFAAPIDEPKEIVAKAIQATGQKTAPKFLSSKEKQFIGNADSVVRTVEIALPDRMRISEERAGQRAVVTVLNGDRAWTERDGRVADLDPGRVTELQNDLHRRRLWNILALQDADLTLLPAEGSSPAGESLRGVRVEAKDRQPVELFFDPETGDLAASRSGNVATLLRDWDTRGGVYGPRSRRSRSGAGEATPQVTEILETKLLTSLDPSLFEKR